MAMIDGSSGHRLGVVMVAAAMATAMVAWRSWCSFRRPRRVPITILSGFLGAGKTTLLTKLLHSAKGSRIAVLVNDLAEVNVDANLVQRKGKGSSMVAFGQIEDGCVCCTAEVDLVGIIIELLKDRSQIDHLVIECSGMAQPSSLLEMFAKAELEAHFTNCAYFSQLVTVVDGRTLLKWLEAANGTLSTNWDEETSRLSELLVEQIECADVVILSKVDCLLQAQLGKCRAAITALNPDALLEPYYKFEALLQYASFGAVFPSIILGTKRKYRLLSQKSKKGTPNDKHAHFDHEENHDHHDHKDHGAPHVRSFVYKSRSPFHPQRLVGLLRDLRQQSKANVGRGVLRSKGLIWLATDMETSREWAQVGEALHIHNGDSWKQKWCKTAAAGTEDELKSGEVYGDRCQEIIFIGTEEMDEVAVRKALNSCLLTVEEMEGGPNAWIELPDPVAITPTESIHRRSKTHGVGCTCCDPDLKAIDQMVSRHIR